jgi:HK97 gp10 family phage protein
MAAFTIRGVSEVDRALRELGPTIGRKVIRQAVRAGLRPMLATAKQMAPRQTGQVRRAIKLRAAARRRRGVIRLVIQIGSGDFKGKTFYGAFREYGTKRMEGAHFMERAFESGKDSARATTIREIRAGIEREASRR